MKLHPVNKEEIEQKTRMFFHSQKWKDVLVFLVFVAIASGFWFMQYFRQTSDSAVAAVSRNPQAEADLAIDSLREGKKEIPVRISGTLSPAPGYRFVDSLLVDPSKIWVYGDEEILDTLQWINTASLTIEKIQKNIHLNVKLQVPKGLTASVQKVRIAADLEEFAEKKLELSPICRNAPDNIHVRFFPSTVAIVCYIALSDYASLKPESLEVGVDYNDLLQNTDVNIAPSLLRKPQWLDDYRIVPETVEYLIEQKRRL